MAISSVIGVGVSLFSGLLKKPQTKDGLGKFVGEYNRGCYGCVRPYIKKWIDGYTLTSQERDMVVACATSDSQKWTKAQKKSLQEALKQIPVKDPKPPPPPEVHTISASYNLQPLVEGIQKSRDVNEVVQTPSEVKISPTLIFIGIGALILILALRKG